MVVKLIRVNEGKEKVKLYYDVDFVYEQLPADALYFHAHWTRQMNGQLGNDFEILPKVNGKGRFLGMSVGLNTDSSYGKSWWGEGEIKMYIDGDTKYPLSTEQVLKIILAVHGVWALLRINTRVVLWPMIQPGNLIFTGGMSRMLFILTRTYG